jgi:pilus assembly protein CpaC
MMERQSFKAMPQRRSKNSCGDSCVRRTVAWTCLAMLSLSTAQSKVQAGVGGGRASPAGDAAAPVIPTVPGAAAPPLVYPAPVEPAPAAQASDSSGQAVIADGLSPDGRLILSVNRSQILISSARFRSAEQNGAAITEGSADIATITPLSPTSILVTGKKPGSTNLIVEDELNRRQVIDVVVEADLGTLRAQLKTLSPQAAIDADDDNGALVLRGHAPSLKVADQAAQVAAAYYGGAKVVNLLEISGGQQVMLEVKFAEVSKSAMSQLGVNFGYFDGTSFVGNNIGGVNPFGVATGVTSGPADPFEQALAISAPGANIQLFGNLNFNKSVFDYFINCLRENQLMRTLAEPDLTAISGETASFQVGGEIPIPVPQPGAGTSSAVITIQYHPYGVLLHFTPVVLGDGRIRLAIDPEVSNIDNSNAVTVSGFKIPAFTTRTVDTTVELADGQTFTIAGLLSNQASSTADLIPALGDVPILGALFRSVEYTRNQTELVVMVTPHLVEPVNPEQVTPAPGEHWRYPTEADLFLMRDLGGEAAGKSTASTADKTGAAASSAGPVPQFHGQYGFTPTADTHVVEP